MLRAALPHWQRKESEERRNGIPYEDTCQQTYRLSALKKKIKNATNKRTFRLYRLDLRIDKSFAFQPSNLDHGKGVRASEDLF